MQFYFCLFDLDGFYIFGLLNGSRSGPSVWPCLVPDLRGDAFSVGSVLAVEGMLSDQPAHLLLCSCLSSEPEAQVLPPRAVSLPPPHPFLCARLPALFQAAPEGSGRVLSLVAVVLGLHSGRGRFIPEREVF